jgi:hypothetical protein
MKLSSKINGFIHPLFVRYVMRAYKKKIALVEKEHPELFKPVSAELTKKHKELWERVGLPCSDRWLRLHVNLTGIQDHRFCPEDIFFARIERILNDSSSCGYGVEDKNLIDFYVPEKYLPETIVRFVRGVYFNKSYQFISTKEVNNLLSFDVGDLVAKPCTSTSGGSGVQKICFKSSNYYSSSGEIISAEWLRNQGHASFLIQKKVQQSEFTAKFNPESVNTFRIMTFRCPWNGKIVVLSSRIRIGITNTITDNLTRGGICVNVANDGKFTTFGYDKKSYKHEKHPVSGIFFENQCYPDLQLMKECALTIAAKIPHMNLLSLDLVPTIYGDVKCIEINASSQGITQSQYDFGCLFGEFTEQLVDWCAANLHLDRFEHFRTFY